METEPPPASAAPPPPVPTSPKPPAPPAEAAEPAPEVTTTPEAAVEAPAAAPAAAAEAVAEPEPAAVNPYEPQPAAAAAAEVEAEGAAGEEAVIVEEQAEDPDDNSEDDGIAGAFKSKVKEPTRYAHKDGAALRATKREVMEGVNAFEAKRVAYFKSQTSTNVRYWTALKEMAGESKAEAERLVGWFNGRLAAQRAYACALLDVNDETAGIKKGATRTALFGKSASTTQLSFSSRRGSSGALGQLPTGTVIKGAVGAAGGNGELQDELCGMDVTQAQEIMELIVLLEGTTGAELKKGHIDISTQVEMVITEGNDFLVSLDALGLYVDNEYDTLRQAAAVTLDEDPLSHGKKAAAAAAKVAEVDFWLLDARYRVAVRQQRSAWAAAEGIMAGLFGRLRDLELARRACTKKAIDELLLKQTELTGKPLTAQPFVAACLARVALTPEALDKHIKEEAARKATSSIAPVAPAVAAEEGAPVPPPPAPEPDAPTDMGFMDHLVASLDSPLVLASEVLERKAKSMTSRSFVTTLVVLTADHHLHMFDVKGKAPGSSAKAAFDSLIPLIDANARPNKTPKKYTIAPSATLDVSAFTAGKRGKQTKLVHASQFHVVEVKANSGVKHFFKKESLSKASLRARSEANCEEWLQRLNALCEPAAGEA